MTRTAQVAIALLIIACGSSAPSRADVLWVDGTPAFRSGEGVAPRYRLAQNRALLSADTPIEALRLNGHTLPSGQVHRVRLSRASTENGGGSQVETWQVDEVLQSEPATEFVPVSPGVSVSGLTLQAVEAMGSRTAEIGPFRVDSSAPSVAFDLRAVGGIRVAGRDIPFGTSTENLLTAFSGCHAQHNRGASVYTCDGIEVIEGYSPEGQGQIVIRVVSR